MSSARSALTTTPKERGSASQIPNTGKGTGPCQQQQAPPRQNLQDQIDRAIETLGDAYTPESTREDLASAMDEALGILRGEDEEPDTDEDEIDGKDDD